MAPPILPGGVDELLDLKPSWSIAVPIVVIAVNYDPTERGYVARLARPGGNVTGVVFRQSELVAKNVELMAEAPAGRACRALRCANRQPVQRRGTRREDAENASSSDQLGDAAVRFQAHRRKLAGQEQPEQHRWHLDVEGIRMALMLSPLSNISKIVRAMVACGSFRANAAGVSGVTHTHIRTGAGRRPSRPCRADEVFRASCAR
jgi:hypothetical protein